MVGFLWDIFTHPYLPMVLYGMYLPSNISPWFYMGCIYPSISPHFYPSALRAGGVLSSWSGRAGGWAGGCQTCGTHISVTAWWIFSVRSSMELSRPVVVHWHAHTPICPIWACPWAKKLVKLATNWVQTLRIAYLWNRWMNLPPFKVSWTFLDL